MILMASPSDDTSVLTKQSMDAMWELDEKVLEIGVRLDRVGSRNGRKSMHGAIDCLRSAPNIVYSIFATMGEELYSFSAAPCQKPALRKTNVEADEQRHVSRY